VGSLVFRGGTTCATNPATCGLVTVANNGSSYIQDNTAVRPADLRSRNGVWLRPSGPVDLATPRQWDRQANVGAFTLFLSADAIDVRVAEQSTTCGMWVWRAGADGGVGPEYGSGCNSFLAPSAFNASPERTPPLQQVRTFGLSNGGSVLTGFDQSACGEGAGYVQGCDAYYVHDDLSAGPVGSGVVQADTLGDQSALVWLERTGTTGTLYRAPLQQPWVPAQLASGLALPASYLPGERAFYVNETGTHVFLRDAQGLKAFPSAGGAPANLLPGAVIARQFIARAALMLPKRHLLVHTYAGSGAPSSTA
jgi:hypothetical protein